MGCLALNRNFILSGLSKMRLWRGRESNVVRGRRDLRTHFRPLAIRIYDFSDVEKAMIQGVVLLYLGILYSLAYRKCDLGEVEKQYSNWSLDISYTFSHSYCPKIRLWLGRECDDSIGYVVLTRHIVHFVLSKMRRLQCRESYAARSRQDLSTHFRLLAFREYDFSKVRESDDSRVSLALPRHSLLSGLSKMRLGRGQ